MPSYKTCTRPSVLVGRGRVWRRAPIGSDAERRLRTDTGRSEVDEVGFVVLKTVVVVSLIARVFAFVLKDKLSTGTARPPAIVKSE